MLTYYIIERRLQRFKPTACVCSYSYLLIAIGETVFSVTVDRHLQRKSDKRPCLIERCLRPREETTIIDFYINY